LGREGHSETIPPSQAAQILTFLSQRGPSQQSRTLVARASPASLPPLVVAHPFSDAPGSRGHRLCRSGQRGGLGFAALESVVVTWGRGKLLPVHLLRARRWGRGLPTSLRYFLGPRNAMAGTRAVSWVPRAKARWTSPHPSASGKPGGKERLFGRNIECGCP
jgi:hypothetical protein